MMRIMDTHFNFKDKLFVQSRFFFNESVDIFRKQSEINDLSQTKILKLD